MLTRAFVLLLVLALGGLLAGPWILTSIGKYLTVDGSPGRADAIVVVSGDGGSRLQQGVKLYKDGYAPVMVLAGAGEEGNPSAAEVMKRQAVSLGVPASAISLVDQSRTTREDATYTRDLLAEQGLKSALLVTSSYHGRRASLTFAKAFDGSGIRLASYPVRDDRWREDSWWASEDTIRITMNELMKLVYYRLNGYL
jgi:uncharacterized SAM-binding protein YcdF (DUF218 family)